MQYDDVNKCTIIAHWPCLYNLIAKSVFGQLQSSLGRWDRKFCCTSMIATKFRKSYHKVKRLIKDELAGIIKLKVRSADFEPNFCQGPYLNDVYTIFGTLDPSLCLHSGT